MSDLQKHPPTTQKPKLLHQVRAMIRTKHYSIRTEEAYVNWIRKLILFHSPREIELHLILLIHNISHIGTKSNYPIIAISHGASKRHPKEMGEKEINEFLTDLAVQGVR